MAREITILSIGESGRASVLMFFELHKIYKTPDGLPIRHQTISDLDPKIDELALLTSNQIDLIELGHAIVEIQPITLDEDELNHIELAYEKIRSVYWRRSSRIPEEMRKRYQLVGHRISREAD
jgi:hypothetical protein